MDFKKETLAKILKDIANAYGSISEMSNRVEMNRSHLSQYINQQLSTPPKPNTLKKIADNSRGITNYNELMSICGYEEMTNEYNFLLAGDVEYANLYFEGQNLSNEEKIKK